MAQSVPYTKSVCLYSNSSVGVAVFKGSSASHSQVAIKEQTHPDLSTANQAIKEAMTQASLRHPSICQVYDCLLSRLPGDRYLSIIIEELMDGDLHQELTSRKGKNDPWNEGELLIYLRDLAEACVYAQENRVCHRDIKPQNIFLSGKRVKLGDFGSSANNVSTFLLKTLHGSPFFLSPELKREFALSITQGSKDFAYNGFQSDVYSLGLTFLYLALLEPPMGLMDLSKLEENTTLALDRIEGYPWLREILGRMLALDPGNRPGFKDVFEFANSCLANTSFDAHRINESEDLKTLIQVNGQIEAEFDGNQESKSDKIPVSRLENPEPAMVDFNFDWEASIRSASLSVKSGKEVIFSSSLSRPPLDTSSEVFCCICGAAVLDVSWLDSVSSNDSFSYAYQKLCSVTCLQALVSSVSQFDSAKCIICKRDLQMLSSQWPLVLNCKHSFHDKGCLLAYLRTATSDFQRKLPQECPVCKRQMDATYIMHFFGGPRKFYGLVQQYADFQVCVSCGGKAELKLPCSHYVCQQCCPLTNRRWTCDICGSMMTR